MGSLASPSSNTQTRPSIQIRGTIGDIVRAHHNKYVRCIYCFWTLGCGPSTTTKIEWFQRLDNDCDSNFHYQVHINATHRKVFNKNHKLSRGKRFSLTPMTNVFHEADVASFVFVCLHESLANTILSQRTKM